MPKNWRKEKDYAAVSEILAAHRIKMGLTRKQIAEVAGCNVRSIDTIEHGTGFGSKKINAIIAAYNLSDSDNATVANFIQREEKQQVFLKNMLAAKAKWGLEVIYMLVTDDEYELPLACAYSQKELGLMIDRSDSTISIGLKRYLKQGIGNYRITLSPVCDNDIIEQERLDYFFKGEFDKCKSLTEYARKL